MVSAASWAPTSADTAPTARPSTATPRITGSAQRTNQLVIDVRRSVERTSAAPAVPTRVATRCEPYVVGGGSAQRVQPLAVLVRTDLSTSEAFAKDLLGRRPRRRRRRRWRRHGSRLRHAHRDGARRMRPTPGRPRRRSSSGPSGATTSPEAHPSCQSASCTSPPYVVTMPTPTVARQGSNVPLPAPWPTRSDTALVLPHRARCGQPNAAPKR